MKQEDWQPLKRSQTINAQPNHAFSHLPRKQIKMKTFKSTFLPFLAVLLFSIPLLMLQSCDPEDCDDDENDNGCDTCIQVLKPNIYIYPKQEVLLNVQIDFPRGGNVIASIPDYGNGWTVTVTPDGKIDGQYDYLFYESEQPNVFQTEKGWCIKTEDLDEFFRQNMAGFGFQGREINDFTEYWIPRLQNSEYYLMYPQTSQIIDEVIVLTFSETPDNIQRLFYLIQEADSAIEMEAPEISSFNREDFFVAEWGVILK